MAARKQAFFSKLLQFLDEYPKILLVEADNVGSFHMQQIRIGLRGRAELLMGKNTMIRKAIKGHLQTNPELEALIPHIRGNIGFVFTKEDLQKIRDEVKGNTVSAPARVGGIAPIDVFVEPGVTTLDPSMTSFMQALQITTKISKGCIEITNKIHLIKAGEKVTSSQSSLLQKLNINPFSYGLIPIQAYDAGVCFPPMVLDLPESQILKNVSEAIQNLAAVSLASNFPTAAAVPHYVGNAYNNLVAVSVATDYTFDRVAELKQLLSDPEAMAAALAAAPAASSSSEADSSAASEEAEVAPAEAEPAAEEEEEEDGDFLGGLF